MHLKYRNVNHALFVLPGVVLSEGIVEDTRNGPATSLTDPVTVTTLEPTERVLLCPMRRANPFLFLLDGLSILSSVDKLKPFTDITPRFASYSDDGLTLRGHYGKRLAPQLAMATQMLLENTATRRISLSIWDPLTDLGTESRDIPCNVQINLRVIGNELDLTVFNRSNDLFWGMLGANIVQFSFLLEFLAARTRLEVGRLHQVSTNLHIYRNFGPGASGKGFSRPPVEYPPVVPLDPENLRPELDMLFRSLARGDIPLFASNPFINNVVLPMLRARKTRNLDEINSLPDCDWFVAARMYMGGDQ